jgi:hypothetical protein
MDRCTHQQFSTTRARWTVEGWTGLCWSSSRILTVSAASGDLGSVHESCIPLQGKQRRSLFWIITTGLPLMCSHGGSLTLGIWCWVVQVGHVDIDWSHNDLVRIHRLIG